MHKEVHIAGEYEKDVTASQDEKYSNATEYKRVSDTEKLLKRRKIVEPEDVFHVGQAGFFFQESAS